MKIMTSEETEVMRLINSQPYPGRRKILVIEDDMMTQTIWLQILKQAEPDAFVLWADSAEEALALIDQRVCFGDPFHFVISDINLAGEQTGFDVWKAHRQSALSFLFGSSVSFEEFTRATQESTNQNPVFLVRKPFDPGECSEMVRTLLYYKDVCITDYTE